MGDVWNENPQNATNPSASAATVDPYEDWEKATRPPAGGTVADDADAAGESVLWQPVYAEIRLTSAATRLPEAIRAILKAAGDFPKELVLTDEALAAFGKAGTSETGPQADAARRFFMFRPESVAYSDEVGGAKMPFGVVEAGPAIPFAFVTPPAVAAAGADARGAVWREGMAATAIIDDQIGFLNERFRKAHDQTRIERLWLQAMPTFGPPGRRGMAASVAIGREFSGAEISGFLRSDPNEDSIYRSIYEQGVGFVAGTGRATTMRARFRSATNLADPTYIRPFAFQSGHGTHVLDLAAGYPVESAVEDRPIFAVQVPALAAAETWGARLDLFVLLGVMRILHWADTHFVKQDGGRAVPAPVPVVINISYGVLAGPKDGTAFLEREIARLVGLRNERLGPARARTVVVMPSGNGYRERTRARMALREGQPQDTALCVQPDDLSVSFVEIWLPRGRQARLTIAPPDGRAKTADLSLAPQMIDWVRGGVTIGRVYVQDPRWSGRRRVVIALCPSVSHDAPAQTAPNGRYMLTLEVRGESADIDIDVQRDDTLSTFPRFGRQAYLDGPEVDRDDPETGDRIMPDADGPVTREGTISALATSAAPDMVIAGGAFDRHVFEKPALYAASGLGLPGGGPDLSAVTEETRSHPGRLAAGLFSGSVSSFSGTSMAAPQVARAIVGQLIASGGGDYDLDALVPVVTSRDPRLGRGVLEMTQEPGRVARRMRA